MLTSLEVRWPTYRRFFLCGLLSLYCTVGHPPPTFSSSLLDKTWLAEATPAAVQALLERGADPTARSSDGWTPLHLAAGRNKTPEVSALLLERGADLTAGDSDGRTPLHLAAAFNETPEVSALLLERGADLTARSSDGMTPLHLAARWNKTPEVSALLLERGADPTARDSAGKLPVDYADKNAALKGTDIYWRLHDARF